MKLTRRDWLFAAVIAVVFGVLLVSGGTKKSPPVPRDDRHRPMMQLLADGSGRELVERECLSCHSYRGAPLAAAHPPKEQCLICHPAKVE